MASSIYMLAACALAIQGACGYRANVKDEMEAEALVNWTRSELVGKLEHKYHDGLQISPYDVESDGLLWTGTSRFPGFVFAHGFQKPYNGTEHDMGEDANAWLEHIKSSIVRNSRSFGFHFTTSPKVAAQFGVYHAAQAPKPETVVYDECDDEFDDECVRGILKRHQRKYGCPAEDSPIWEKQDCWAGKKCVRADKLSDPDLGLEHLCPSWGYAYVVRAEGVRVRVSSSHAAGKNYDAEEEVFVPMGVAGAEVLGAIPIYARKSYDGYGLKNPGMINFASNWKGAYGWGGTNMKVPGAHTKDGKDSPSAIGAFIYNPNYKGDARKEIAEELAKKRIANDLGAAVPKEAP